MKKKVRYNAVEHVRSIFLSGRPTFSDQALVNIAKATEALEWKSAPAGKIMCIVDDAISAVCEEIALGGLPDDARSGMSRNWRVVITMKPDDDLSVADLLKEIGGGDHAAP